MSGIRNTFRMELVVPPDGVTEVLVAHASAGGTYRVQENSRGLLVRRRGHGPALVELRLTLQAHARGCRMFGRFVAEQVAPIEPTRTASGAWFTGASVVRTDVRVEKRPGELMQEMRGERDARGAALREKEEMMAFLTAAVGGLRAVDTGGSPFR